MSTTIRTLGAPGDLGWVVMAHGEVYAREYGWDATFEALVLEIVAEFVAKRDRAGVEAWIAEVDGERAGTVFCMPGDDGEAKLRILLVDPRFRGHGVGRLLVDNCLAFARGAGYRRVVLWTNSVLVSARRIYETAGFGLVEEDPHHSFGHDLVGQTWALDL
ncbi:GNAT family N-acetyltransferase [Nocardioides sp. CER19]|uniref:GNAT family N-acetyltransferase n=1 Tax=Nocardioides sp. CER19 TaxID=3038538 RepID=UPI00244886E3|nr:GNAT family N-acetyltransferase [Nocardioides sp. CER19]MDH2414565.1 GNAT family N-acetyltransferase [Nocardioides sp. CER19]